MAEQNPKDIQIKIELFFSAYSAKIFSLMGMLLLILRQKGYSHTAKAQELLSYHGINEGTLQPEVSDQEMRTLNELKNFFDDSGELTNFGQGNSIYQEGSGFNNIYLF